MFSDTYKEEEEEEEDEEMISSSSSAPGGTLFVVDCSGEMVVKDPDTGASQLELSLQAIRNTYCNKLIGGSRDYLGVVLCGTDTKTNDYHGLHILLPLDTPDRECVETLEKLIESSRRGEQECGHSADYSPYHLLWTCSSLYTSCTKKLANRQVMIFTNVCAPSTLDPKTKALAVTKARDMAELDILISLITLASPDGSEFTMETFYSHIVPDHEVVAPTTDLEDLSLRVHKREAKLRVSGELGFVIGPGLTVGVQCYNLYGDAKTTHQNLCNKTNQTVVTVSRVVRETDRSVLLPHEQCRAAEFGSDTVVFSKDELEEMKLQVDKGVYLVGFKPANQALKLHHVAGKSLFIRPSESTYTGSQDFFVALLDRCVSREVVPLVHCVPRSGSIGYIAVLLPQQEHRDGDNDQIKPAGFHLVRLPYAEDVRKLEYEPTLALNPNEIEAGKKLVQKLKAKYSSTLIENPQDQRFQKTLEAIALERSNIEDVEDLTVPDVERLDARTAPERREFSAALFGAGYQIPADCRKPDYKRVIALVQDRQREGTLKKLAVTDLRLYCKGVRLKVPSNAKKADLLDAIDKFLG